MALVVSLSWQGQRACLPYGTVCHDKVVYRYKKFSSNANYTVYTSIQQFNAKPVHTGYSSKMETVSLQREVNRSRIKTNIA